MKRRSLSVTALRALALASAGLAAATGCLNPRPEELPSDTIATEPDGEQPGAGAGTPNAPAPEGPNFSPSEPSSVPDEADEDDGADGAAPDGGLLDAEAADAGAARGGSEPP